MPHEFLINPEEGGRPLPDQEKALLLTDIRLLLQSARAMQTFPAGRFRMGENDAIIAFITRDRPFWGHSPNIWWPEDRAWCVATDIDLFDTYVGGSEDCIEAVLSNPDLEALPTTLDARLDLFGDIINAPDMLGGGE